MIQFDLMGTIDLRRDDGAELDQLLRQAKRLALLAFLVTPSPGTWHRRDTLLGVFWPELDTAHARTALRNALYVLRQALGDGVVVTRGDEDVSIDRARLRTDLDALWTAIRDGRAEEALGRYRGEFLPGLHPGDSEGFDAWLMTQRSRLRTELTRLGAADADRLAREHHYSDSLRVAQRVLEISPDETALRRVMHLHDVLGDRAGGLATYERFTTWLRDELGAGPSAETQALAEHLRGHASTPLLVRTPAPPKAVPITTPEITPLRQPRHALPVSLIGVAALFVVLLAGFVVRGGWSTGANGIGRSYRVTSDDGLQIEPALSPDGQLVAYVSGTAGQFRVWVRRLDGSEPWQPTRDSGAVELMPRWSPHSDQIIYLSRGHAWATVLTGGTPRRVATGSEGDGAIRSASWSPRGDSVLFVRNDSLLVKPLDGPGARFVGRGDQLHSCMWSPDGRLIACVTGNLVSIIPGPAFGNRAASGILIFPARGDAPIRLLDADHQYESPSWTADSRELWVLSDRDGEWGEAFSIPLERDGRAAGPPERVGFKAQWLSLGAGRIAYSVYSRVANVWSLPLAHDSLTAPLTADDAIPVTSGRRIIEIVTVSADGQWLVYDSDERESYDIYRLPLFDSLAMPERLTGDPRDEFFGTTSPDGRHLAYHQSMGGRRRILVKALADGAIEAPWPDSVDQGTPRWSPDGNAVAGWIHTLESGEIFVLRRKAGGGWQRPAWRLRDAQRPVWSPDGRTIAFVTTDGTIASIPADSGARTTVYRPRPGSTEPVATNVIWPVGRDEIWFIGHTPQDVGGIWSVSLRGGRPRQLVTPATSPGRSFGLTFDADRQRLYFVLDERHGNVRYAELTKR